MSLVYSRRIKQLSLILFLLLLMPKPGRAEPISEGAVLSPKNTFTITQTRSEDGVTTRLTFNRSQRTVILQPSPIDWAGFYSVSPDEKWILRIQKTGSGDNTAFLYEVKKSEVSEADSRFAEAAWAVHEKVSPYKDIHYYHSGFEFMAWAPNGYLLLTIHGRSTDEIKTHDIGGFRLKYNLRTKQFTKG